MLTDIFAYRYRDYPIWSAFTAVEQRLLNQSFEIVKEALPYYNAEGKELESSKAKWKALHDQLARELGVDELSQRYYSYVTKGPLGQDWPVQGFWGWLHVSEQFVKAPLPPDYGDSDRFIKERISFVELAMRWRGAEIAEANARLPQTLAEAEFRERSPSRGSRLPGSAVEAARAWNANQNATFEAQVIELNERLRRARAPLTYHNGFFQVSVDEVVERHIAKPFWDLVAGSQWTNVDIDMKEALDRRDSNDKDPALFAAKALESAIKIVSDTSHWTRGTETGAAQYIDNLASKANGSFLAPWEAGLLKAYFRDVRNPLGHGPGCEPMPALSKEQTDWAIENAMSWVRSLIRRMAK